MTLLNSYRFNMAGGNTYASTILADGPGLYMPFNEMTVAPVDATGTHIPTVVGSGITSISDGPFGGQRAYRFPNAVTSHIDVANHASINVADTFTFECWYRPIGIAAYQGLISKGQGSAYVRATNTANMALLASQVAGIVTSTTTMTDTTHWYHLVTTKSGGTVKQYIDGVDRTGTVSNVTIGANAAQITVGADLNTNFNSYHEPLNGDIAHVAVYAIALSAGQVAAHYAARGIQNFAYNGTYQNFVVPAGVTTLTVDLYGAEGGPGADAPGGPGKGGRVKCNVTVTPGETLRVYVGGAGTLNSDSNGAGGGFNGGANTAHWAGGGGGATDIRRTPYTSTLVVAGGGGGAGAGLGTPDGGGGGGGGVPNGVTGSNGTGTTGAGGGTQSAGGAAGTGDSNVYAGTAGSGGHGGFGNYNAGGGGGGGGGYYGGGGGGGATSASRSSSGGGGGSGLSTGVNETITNSIRSGNGVADLTW